MKNGTFTGFLKQNALQLSVQIVGLLVIVFNLYLASKLQPITSRLQTIESKVIAYDEHIDSTKFCGQDIAIVKAQIQDIKEDIGEIKQILRGR